MKQRLQLARTLLHDPKVLILDEPASDLDPRARIEIRDLLVELRSMGKTIFLSSHILTELADVCTSVAILERGRLVVVGPDRGHRAAPRRSRGAAGPCNRTSHRKHNNLSTRTTDDGRRGNADGDPAASATRLSRDGSDRGGAADDQRAASQAQAARVRAARRGASARSSACPTCTA